MGDGCDTRLGAMVDDGVRGFRVESRLRDAEKRG